MGFKAGQRIIASRSQATATVVSVNESENSIIIKYDDVHYGTQKYQLSIFKEYWEIIGDIDLKVDKKCTCGCLKVYGRSCPISFHSDWCDLKN